MPEQLQRIEECNPVRWLNKKDTLSFSLQSSHIFNRVAIVIMFCNIIYTSVLNAKTLKDNWLVKRYFVAI